MKWFKKDTDGGKDSNSIAYFLCEIKSAITILLLKFSGKSREVFHEHAFHCVGWVLKGELRETLIDGRTYTYKPSIFPFFVGRRDFHQVDSVTPDSWVFSIRGPWKKTWREADQDTLDTWSLTHGRKVYEVT